MPGGKRPGQAGRRASAVTVLTVMFAAGLALAGCGTSAAPGGSGSTGTSRSPSGPASAAPSAPASTPGVAGFQVLSMTYVSGTQGFALGTRRCGSGRCLALLGSEDGMHWRQLTAPASKPGGAYSTCPHGGPCVRQLRFATPQVGYAFGPSLFVTTDGGLHWRQLPGTNVSSLEAAGGTIARVMSNGTGCAGQPYQLQSAPDGTTSWQSIAAPGILMICPPVLYRQGSRMVLAGYGNPAGGVRATAEIGRSADDGRTWASGPDACGGKDGYASAVALAPPNVLVLLCQHQMPSPSGGFGPAWVRVSADGGASYGPDQVIAAAAEGTLIRYQLAAASASRLVVTETGTRGSALVQTQDGGKTWTTALTMPGTEPVILVGFEDPLTARVAQASTVWTTTNGARSWTPATFTG